MIHQIKLFRVQLAQITVQHAMKKPVSLAYPDLDFKERLVFRFVILLAARVQPMPISASVASMATN